MKKDFTFILICMACLAASCKGDKPVALPPDAFIVQERFGGMKGEIEKVIEYAGKYVPGQTTLEKYASKQERTFDAEGRLIEDVTTEAYDNRACSYSYGEDDRLEKTVVKTGNTTETTTLSNRDKYTITWDYTYDNPSAEHYSKAIKEVFEEGHIYRTISPVGENVESEKEDAEDLYYDEKGRMVKKLASYWYGPYAQKLTYDEDGFIQSVWTKDRWEERTVTYTTLGKDSSGNPTVILKDDTKDGKQLLVRRIIYKGGASDSDFKEPVPSWKSKK